MENLGKGLPSSPGVYLFKNKTNKTIYVGKAVNLKARVSSYFQKTSISPKTELLVSETEKVDFFRVDSELEALLLEAKLIKRFRPYFNSQLKDDKDYLYIKITREDYPRVLAVRRKDLTRARVYFGPFPSASLARSALKLTRKIFSFRTNCKPNSAKACLASHLGLCPGVCIGKIDRREYSRIIGRLTKFFNGQSKEVVRNLETDMKNEAKKLNFEEAEKYKRMIEAIRTTTKPIENVEKYLSGPEVLENLHEKQANSLAEVLGFKRKLGRIECYDISHLSGSASVGSMVVLHKGEASKNDYRRFRIKSVKGINDTAMLAEVLGRRFRNDWPHPDLIVLDGGRPQLNAGLRALQKVGLKIPIIGLAKRNEEIYLPGQKELVRLPRNSPALYVVQRARDEAHRFAVSYNRRLRSKLFSADLAQPLGKVLTEDK